MSDERYFKMEYDEEWYLFDSTTISEQLVKEQAEYGYGVFANSLSPSEIVDLLNELVKDNEELGISIKLFEDDVATKDKKIDEQQATISALKEENEQLRQSIKELQRSREYWIQDNNRLTKKNNELIAKIDFLERVIDGDV